MQSLFEFLTVHDDIRFVAFIASLAFAVMLETAMPMFRFGGGRVRHVATNLVFVVTSGIITGVLAAIAFGPLNIAGNPYALFSVLAVPLWLNALLGLMLLDFFGQYLIHVCLHKFKWLWKLHLVHHSDTTVDASTGTRHHPGDIAVRETLILCVIAVVGIHPAVYVLYRIITPFFAYLTHANFALPPKLDRWLSYVIVTPTMHKFHHHFERPWTDSNYGNVLSCWDRMFGTFVYGDPTQIRYGVDTVDGAEDLDLAYQFTLPWNPTVKTDY